MYLDYLIIFYGSFEDHMKHFKMVFNCVSRAGFTLNPLKCKALCKEVQYLDDAVKL